jgi:hypothetical protein
MCGRSTAGFVAAVVPLFVLTVSCPVSADDKAPKRYSSPTAVFDAFREARDKRDWRKVFPLLTPEAQSYAVFESFFECTELGSKRTGDAVPKYVDLATLTEDYHKAYKKKHGIGLDEAEAKYKNEPTDANRPHDTELWSDVVVAHVTDKVGFCEAVAKLSEKEPVWPLGDLEQLAVHGDTATGKAKLTLVRQPRGSPPAVDKIDKTYRIRKTDGGWLLDSL